jgi:hypothetical protein
MMTLAYVTTMFAETGVAVTRSVQLQLLLG